MQGIQIQVFFEYGLCIALFVFVIILSIKDGLELLFGAMPLVIGYLIIIICEYIAYGRIFEFSSEGISVSIGKYKRLYLWDELEVKRYFHDTGGGFADFSYGGAEFYYTKIKRSSLIKPSVWCRLRHPVSYIFVNFYTEEKNKYEIATYPRLYPVNEMEFKEMLFSWGVRMEDGYNW